MAESGEQFLHQKGFVQPYFVLALVLIVILLILASKLQIIKNYPLKETGNVQGVLITKGDDEDSGSPTIRIKDDSDEDEVKTEIRFGEGEKIKTKIEDGRTRIDVYSGGVKVRYEIRDGRVIVKAETEEGEELEEQELFKIEDRLGKTGIKVATEGGKLVVARNNVGALSNFPIQLDLNTNQLIASTSAGPKTLTTLPDQAVQNLLAANVISRLDPAVLQQAAQTGGLTSVSDVVALGERNGVPVYEIAGLKDHRLLGFIPVTTPVTVVVSAETGQTVAQEQSLLSTMVDLLSP